jgi:glutamate dehydrogenase (NADP+)
MVNIFKNVQAAATKYNQPKNYILGANVAGFEKVANAMLAHGVI